MPRGRLLRTKRKEAYHLGKAEEKGRLQAQREHERKLKLSERLRAHLLKFIDRLSADDIAFLSAWIGLTLIIKQLIDTTQDLKDKLGALGFGPRFRLGPINPFGRINPVIASMLKIDQTGGEEEGIFPDSMDYLVASTIAYIVLKYPKEIMGIVGVAGKNLSSLVSFLLG